MQQQPKFVLAWIHRGGNDLFPHGGMNLLVKHPSRGWEFPGGRVRRERILRCIAQGTPRRMWNRSLWCAG